MKIKEVQAFQIFDSRGTPTVECSVILDDGLSGNGLVPAGASTGQYEALELRDGDEGRFGGKSVWIAIDNIERLIAPAVRGQDVFDQRGIDRIMLDLDGSERKSNLGANAILAVSMAVCNAAARARCVPLYEYLGGGEGDLIPLPHIQIFGGGAHSAWRTDIQDFLIIPLGATSYMHSLEISHNVYRAAGDWMRQHQKSCGVADEGGFWPVFDSHRQILDTMVRCIERAGYEPGKDVAIALDIAASEFFDGQKYRLNLDRQEFSTAEFAGLLAEWCGDYPVLSLEDPMADVDRKGWENVYRLFGDQIQIIGDDLFTTNPVRIRMPSLQSLANAVLIKPNQIGTISETIDAIRATQDAGWRPIISARSGETEDTFISHLAVATNAGQLKVGSFSRGERMAKWNELLRIERGLSKKSRFIGRKLFITGQNPLKSNILVTG